MHIRLDDLVDTRVIALLEEHVTNMRAITPAEHVFALDVTRLRAPGISFYTAWDGDELAACGALKELAPGHGELKSMRTPEARRGRGAGRAMLTHLLREARRRGYRRVSLETGSQPFFGPAQALYRSAGFAFCGPFGDYQASPDNVFMTLALEPTPMPSRIQELIAFLDSNRVELAAAFATVPDDARDRRPAPDRWSAAEVVEHLAIVEGGIVRLLNKQLDAARAAGLGPETSTEPVVPTLPVDKLRDRTAPINAPERVLPKGQLSAAAAWQLLEDNRTAMLATLRGAEGLALGEMPTPPHPALGPLNAYQWVVFVGAHEGRHAAQLRELADESPFE